MKTRHKILRVVIPLSVAVLVAAGLRYVRPVAAEAPAKDVSALCGRCHKAAHAYTTKAVVHRPVKEGLCTLCHSPHASRHSGLLKGQGSALCYTCHDRQKFLGRVSVHKPVEEGNCSVCHESHSSDAMGLLKKSGPETCFSCHPSEDMTGKRHVHPEVKKGNCTACHEPHSSDTEGLMAGTRPGVCAKCHKTVNPNTHWGYDVSGSDCFSCHSPHTSDRPGLVKATLHKPFEEKRCTACHERGGRELLDRTSAMCSGCHKATMQGFQRIYTHLTPGMGGDPCSTCHNPHASDAKELLKEKETRMCFKCHSSTKDFVKASRFKHPKLEKCSDCHASHGSDTRYFLSSEEGGCSATDCHATQGTFTHPVGEKIIDPRSKTPMTCVTCHSVMGSSEEFNLRYDKEMELCVQCHQL
jgi:predicted CXXCH cytochrome family protein